ncbi:MAG: nuclear transport factor 2 family protein [Acidobacteria bacterium]|nr:nuclear transport factor 2 family protein [Acidobacteriota bacterium]
MPRSLLSLVLLAAGLALTGCSQPAPPPGSGVSQTSRPAPDPGVLERREQERVSYLVAGDFERLGAMLSPTLSYTHSNAALDSKENFLGDLRSGQVVYRSLSHRDVEVRFIQPGVAILNGLTDAVVSVAGGEDQEIPLRFTIVYVERDGEWLFEAWHSVRRPPA